MGRSSRTFNMSTLTEHEREKLKARWPNLTDSLIDEYRDTFAVFDLNGDGSLAPEEVQRTMQKLGFQKTLSQINQIIMKVDEDRNGVIDFLEFVSLMQMQRDDTNELRRAFEVFDKNGDGKISASEVKEVFIDIGHPMTNEEIDFLFKTIDENGDGFISFDEFENMMKFGPPHLVK
eukprot:c6592_g1_i1.p1 GENE.c6592_g1_i1~~c6592_g1_i1.p1  ORF type:complete len:176 (-),score=41.90 c6592_g1_i1:39-566(-)